MSIYASLWEQLVLMLEERTIYHYDTFVNNFQIYLPWALLVTLSRDYSVYQRDEAEPTWERNPQTVYKVVVLCELIINRL